MTSWRSASHTLGALSDASSAILLARFEAEGALRVEMANATARDLFGPELELGEVLLARMRAASDGAAPARERLELESGDGTVVDVDLELEVIPEARGRASRVLAVVRRAATDGAGDAIEVIDEIEVSNDDRALDEQRFRLIADSSPTGIYFAETTGIVSYANNHLAEILGEPIERVVGRSFLEWVHPDDLSIAVEAGELIAAQGRDTNVELRIRRRGGEVRWLRAQGAPVVDTDGAIHGFVGSIIDITDQRALERGSAMLGRAIESAPDLVTFHDRDGRMFFANTAAREFFGIADGEPVPPLGPAEFLDAEPDQLLEIAETLDIKNQWSGELVVASQTGRRMPVEIVVVSHRDESGAVEYYSALSRDLTERSKTEQARARSEAVLRAIVQSSPLAIFALDRSGAIHVWNRAAETLFGWPAAEVIGGPAPFTTHESHLELDDLIARVFRGRTVKGFLGRYARRDGTLIDVDLSIAPLRNAEGRVVTAVAVIADITEQKRAVEAVRESEVWFRSLVQHSTDMVLVIGEDGMIRYLSPSAQQFVGDTGDAMRRRVNEVFEPDADDLDELVTVFARLRATPGATERVTFRAKRADGEWRHVEMAASNLLDDPAVRGIVVNGRDVSETVEADALVRSSEERLRALVSGVSDAIVVLAADGSLVYSSPVAERMFDIKMRDPASVFSRIDPADLPRALQLWEEVRVTPGFASPAEVRIQMGDGSVMDAEVVANNLLDDPAVQGIVMTIRDVTARKTADRALRESEGRLRQSEARYRAVVDDQIELVCRYLPDTTITFVNRAFAEFYGRSRDELIGTRLIDLHSPVAREHILERVAAFGTGSEVQTYDEWELGADGTRRCYRWIDRAFLDRNGKPLEVQSVGHDVTEERRASVLTANQADILEQVARGVPLEETLHAIASSVEQHFPRLSCAVFLLDADGAPLRLVASPSLPREVLADQSVEPAWSTPILAADGRTVLGRVGAYGRDAGPPDDEQRRIFSLVAHLASIAIERKAFEERLAHQSMHDLLTGLPNRLLFLDRLGLAIARGKRTGASVAVLFLDLDRFKNFNDSVGHDAGDELLVSVARRLESMLRPGDTVARFGADEFTVLCEDLAPEAARERAVEIAQRLLSSMAHPFVVRDAETYVGVSIGIALTTSGDETAEELLRDADAAMNHAKETGRGRIEVFDDTMRARALARHSTENALHRAIERDELRLFFQPIVNLEDASCIGVEALVRWQHPERGLVPPNEFVPLAEETGLVVSLGTWVLEHAAAQAARWQLKHPNFSVSINLSARQLTDPNFTDTVAQVIERCGVAPHNLCFEITESALVDDADTVMRIVEQLRQLGVRFAIDDFGTGYSSLGYLKRFEVDTVKIDRGFVDGLGDDPGDRAIVSAVIGLAHELGLRVVAEGVETEAQLTELVSLGCDEAQGYYFAPPQPAADLKAVVSTSRRWRPPGSTLMGR